MPSDYGWIITKDHLAEPGDRDEAGTTGPRGISDEMKADLIAGKGKAFRIYDGDGELNYSGKLAGDAGFGPLDDFGTPNGATEIRYRNPDTKKWETL